MLRTNIKNALLTLVFAGRAYKFNSITNITHTDPKEIKRKKSMQNSNDFIDYSTANQEPCTADITLSPVTKEEFILITNIYKNRDKFDLSLIDNTNGQFITFTQPTISKKPMQETINEDETSFDVKLMIICNEIEYILN